MRRCRGGWDGNLGVRLRPKGEFSINYWRAAYPLLQLSPVIASDYLPNLNRAQPLSDSNPAAIINRPLGVATSEPMHVWHDQKVNTSAFTLKDTDAYVGFPPDVLWNITGTGTQEVHHVKIMPQNYQGLEMRHTDTVAPGNVSSVSVTAVTPTSSFNCQGLTALISKATWLTAPTTAAANWWVGWTIGTRKFQVLVDSTGKSKIQTRLTGDLEWQTLQSLRLGADINKTTGNTGLDSGAGNIAVSVLFLNNALQVSVGIATTPYLHDCNIYADIVALSQPIISVVEIGARYYSVFSFSAHPLKWRPSVRYVSADKKLNTAASGFTDNVFDVKGLNTSWSVSSGGGIAPSFPAGSTIQPSVIAGDTSNSAKYNLAISNPVAGTYLGENYSDYTASVVGINMRLNNYTLTSASWPWTNIAPVSIVCEAVFDPQALTIRRHLIATFNNFRGQYGAAYGTLAVRFKAGYYQPSMPLHTQFTGLCQRYRYNRSGGSQSTVSMICTDLMPIFDQAIGSPFDMDGWNHYYALFYLASYVGLPRVKLGFANMIPDGPFGISSHENPATAYFLPRGSGNNPWTPRNRNMLVRDLIDYVRKPVGFMLYFDENGLLQYHKWKPPGTTAARAFTEVPLDGSVGYNALREFWNHQFETSTENVNNVLLLIGVDQYSMNWEPIVAYRRDEASINGLPGEEPINYVGWPRQFVWSDPRFANQAFSEFSADKLFALQRLPEVTTSLTSWMQPDIYPMDVITVDERKSGANDVPNFYVVGVRTEWSAAAKPYKFETTLTGRYLVE